MNEIIHPTPKEIQLVTPTLARPEFTAFVRGVLGINTAVAEREPLTLVNQLRVYTYEWLRHLKFVNELQCERLLMRQLPIFFTECADSLAQRNRSDRLLFIITDQRYAGWEEGLEGFWYDLLGNCRVKMLPVPGVTHISLDLTALFDLRQGWLRRIRGKDGTRHLHPAAEIAASTPSREGDPEDPHQ